MLASMLKNKPGWLNYINHLEDYCDQIMDDLAMAEGMPSSRYVFTTERITKAPRAVYLACCSYVRVRFEDLVSEEHTVEILRELYKFMGIPFDLKAWNSTLGYLMHGESHASHGEYWSLFRDKDFDPNHWTKHLKNTVGTKFSVPTL